MCELPEEDMDFHGERANSAPAPSRRFAWPLSAAARARIEQDRRETLRLYGLGNAWLASALLAAARDAQAAAPHRTPDECTYDARLIWGIVPELARRLGVVKLTTNEIDWEIRELSDYDLRVRAGYALKNIGYTILPGWRLLTRDVGNGNMVVYALDRLCPGRLGDREDPIVRNLTELAACRRRPYEGVWTPAMNLADEPVDEVDDGPPVLDSEDGDLIPLRPGS